MILSDMTMSLACLFLIEVIYWIAFVASARALYESLRSRRSFEIVFALSLIGIIWPWSRLAAAQLLWILFD